MKTGISTYSWNMQRRHRSILLIEISVCNRGPDEAVIHVLPTLWFRNIWAWWPEEPKPFMKGNGPGTIAAKDSSLGTYFLHCEGASHLLFTENETINERLFSTANPTPYVRMVSTNMW